MLVSVTGYMELYCFGIELQCVSFCRSIGVGIVGGRLSKKDRASWKCNWASVWLASGCSVKNNAAILYII